MVLAQLTRQEILDRLQTVATTLSATLTNLFPAAVPTGKIRYVVGIILIGDGAVSRTVSIAKVSPAGVGTTVFPNLPVQPTAIVQLPQANYEIEDPIITCEDQTYLAAQASGGTPFATVIYWDSER